MRPIPPTPKTSALLATLALALAAGLAAPAAFAAEKGVETDLTSGLNRIKQDRTVAGVQDLGAKWVRLTMSWADVEQAKGSYSELSRYDTAITKAASSGAKLVVTVHESPAWASGRTNPSSPPTHAQDYANFMRFAAARWGNRVDAWEVWNEQNNAAFWSTGPDPARYASLLKAAYPAVKVADPTALVVYGGVSENDYRFVEQSYAAEPGLGDYYDVMASHPYPTPANISPTRTWLDGDGRLAASSFSAYREIRAVMLAYGDDKPMWLTEFGWSTTAVEGWGVDEATQAAYLRLAMECLEQDPYVAVAIWHVYRNDQLGLVRTDFSRKLAYEAFKGYTPGTTGCAYEDPGAPPPIPAPAPEPSPDPDPAPAPEPEPTAAPELDPEPEAASPVAEPAAGPATVDEPAGEPQSETEGVQSSSVRVVEIRVERLAQTAGSPTRRVRMRVAGQVSNTRRGHVDLSLTCRARGDGDWRRSMTRRLDIGRAGEYATLIRPRRRAVCRMRAAYYAFGVRLGRSEIVRFRT